MTKHVDEILPRIMKGILSGKYGDKLPKQEIFAKELGVGRSTLREAVSRLECFNIVECHPKSGTKIMPHAKWRSCNRDVMAWAATARKNDPTSPPVFTLSYDGVIEAWTKSRGPHRPQTP